MAPRRGPKGQSWRVWLRTEMLRDVYDRELKTFQEYGDTGEIWFGEVSVTQLIRWTQKHKIPLDASVLDIGAGNGVFLVELGRIWFL